MKGRAVADRRKQRSGSNKSDITLPTAANESVLIPASTDATEGRDVAVIGAPGAFLADDMEEEVIVIL